MPEISIKAETLFRIGSFGVNNSMALSLVVMAFFIFLFLRYDHERKSGNRSHLFYLVNMVLRGLYDLFQSIVHEKIGVFFPLLSGFFIWILVQNWTGLLPGVGSIMVQVPASVVHGTQVHETAEAVDEAPVQVIDEHGVTTEEVEQSAEPEKEEMLHIPLFRGNNADINATLALAIISVFMIQVYGIQFLGLKTYISKFLNFKDPIYFVLGILEIISEVSKVVSFAFRLFGNIFAGEVLLTIVAFLVPVLASFPFVILEVFVGLVQALVFSMLTSVFLSLAVSHH
jgi:F-type H+-transporting ATPase subunit a